LTTNPTTMPSGQYGASHIAR